jgi:hypothetical protein
LHAAEPAQPLLHGRAHIIRGLTPEQIKDVLALPNLPDMITIVTVPVGTCVLYAKGAAVPGFGSGGTAQAYAAGTPSGPHCDGLQFLPADDDINRQALGAYALLYGPHAGKGNGGAVAAALDQGPYPVPFTDMDLVYKKLDLLNFGDPAPLRSALVQLDGEIYADVSSVAIGAGQLYLGTLREQMRTERPSTGPLQQWVNGFGASLGLSGTGHSHDFDADTGGVAGGIEHRFTPGLTAGIAAGWAFSDFGTREISGSGDLNTFAVTPYTPASHPAPGISRARPGARGTTHRLAAASSFPASPAGRIAAPMGQPSCRKPRPAIVTISDRARA